MAWDEREKEAFLLGGFVLPSFHWLIICTDVNTHTGSLCVIICAPPPFYLCVFELRALTRLAILHHFLSSWFIFFFFWLCCCCCCCSCFLYLKKKKRSHLFSSTSVTVPSPRIDPEVEDIVESTPQQPVGAAEGATADERLDEELTLLQSSEEIEAAVQVVGDSLPASRRVESPIQLPNIDPALLEHELTVSTTTILQV